VQEMSALHDDFLSQDSYENVSRKRSERPEVRSRTGAVLSYGEDRRPEIGTRSSFIGTFSAVLKLR
jgi:hypothetical protein